jgi:lipopolysaccharide export system permease protein
MTVKNNYLQFKLYNGWDYQETGSRYNPSTDFTRFSFKSYLKEFDLSTFKMDTTPDSLFKADPKMYTSGQLVKVIDSLGDVHKEYYAQSSRDLKPYMRFLRYGDSTWKSVSKMHIVKNAKSFSAFIPDSLKSTVYNATSSTINFCKSNVEILARDYTGKKDLINAHWIELYRKFTLSIACVVLFMIGAPLGSIIRKGGLGLPLVFAIIFFVLFHLLNTFGEKFARQGVTSVMIGMWLSTILLVPVGIFLTIKAMRDSQLFNKEFYYRFFKNVRGFLSRVRLIRSST